MWIAVGTLTYVLFLLGLAAAYGIQYMTSTVKIESFSQVLYTMQVSMGGAGNTIIQILTGFLAQYWLLILIATAAFIWYIKKVKSLKKDWKTEKKKSTAKKAVQIELSVLCLALIITGFLGMEVFHAYDALGMEQYQHERSTYSTLYEDHYVKPDTVNIKFPAHKKNLIYILCESMESSYSDKADGGAMDSNLIPNLTRLAQENVNFTPSGSDLNGGRVSLNTSWTVAGIIAQSSGTPLTISNGQLNRNIDEDYQFMPKLITLGDVLKAQGYHNYFMCGSEAAYAGRANYFKQHGDYQIYDLIEARNEGFIPEDYNVWWGFEDAKLMDYAKQKLSAIAKHDQPFNFTMLTADTHFSDGYLCEDCPDVYDEQMENVIACSDARVAELVEWIQQQPWYKDTVIVIGGDHLSMDGLFPRIIDEDYSRRTYDVVINGPEYTLDYARDFTTMDMFPTILEALGCTIDGHRLGLGTSLYSDVPTLTETMGFEELNRMIPYRSKFYENEISNVTTADAE